MDADSLAYLDKAIESLAGAESEYANNRYNNCANRCYYAMFQAAIAALIAAGIRPAGVRAQWEHAFVQARFAGVLVKRRKLYPSELARSFELAQSARLTADYGIGSISEKEAGRALSKARVLVTGVQEQLA
ncbi:MAG: hypothetical protein QG637_1481 [Chloroflexota bacterium]|nr:hypothetical protein [Chloroflexota bacterium]